ncbi:hypothetical protein F5Y16DRAFT_217742 [Xylariaceae sp. FL0255]|nr:hypothetical protein F5Y16DRAFT_217742 [Xylariaceae sp. FL0255]
MMTAQIKLEPLCTDRHRLQDMAIRAAQAPLTSPSPIFPTISPDSQSPLVSRLEKTSLSSTNRSPTSDEDTGIVRLPLTASYNQTSLRAPDAFVIARSIRRSSIPSASASGDCEGSPREAKSPDRLTLRAVVRPKQSERHTFMIQRTLDVDELRAATKKVSIPVIKPPRKPLPGLSSRRASLSSSCHAHAHGVSNSFPTSPGSISDQAQHESVTEYEKVIRDPKAVPIYLQHIGTSLPALVLLLISGHVHRGDVVYVPVPHAEAWHRTIRYVSTGRGELLTPAVRENILYMGGKV